MAPGQGLQDVFKAAMEIKVIAGMVRGYDLHAWLHGNLHALLHGDMHVDHVIASVLH